MKTIVRCIAVILAACLFVSFSFGAAAAPKAPRAPAKPERTEGIPAFKFNTLPFIQCPDKSGGILMYIYIDPKLDPIKVLQDLNKISYKDRSYSKFERVYRLATEDEKKFFDGFIEARKPRIALEQSDPALAAKMTRYVVSRKDYRGGEVIASTSR
jgi:hypothetical protein